jgi:hypothetical protein
VWASRLCLAALAFYGDADYRRAVQLRMSRLRELTTGSGALGKQRQFKVNYSGATAQLAEPETIALRPMSLFARCSPD